MMEENKIQAYTSKFSYWDDEDLLIRVNTLNKSLRVKVYRFNDLGVVYMQNINSNFTQTPEASETPFISGFGWKVNIALPLKDYPPGLYFIELHNHNSSPYYLLINIKNKALGGKNLVLLNTNTWNAYNASGGANFYRYNLDKKTQYGPWKHSRKIIRPTNKIGVTFSRPFDNISKMIARYVNDKGIIGSYYDHLLYGELRLLKFMDLSGISFDLFDDRDLHEDAIDISKYNNLVLNCHPEYWSHAMMRNIQIKANNIISLAGNVGYRKIRWDGDIIYCDPYSKSAGIWPSSELINIVGSYYSMSGAGTHAPYKILKPDHPLFSPLIDEACKEYGIERAAVAHFQIGSKSLNKAPASKEDGISGHETDKRIPGLDADILAKGTNLKNGGGDILSFEAKKTDSTEKRSIISVGSIVFTGGLFADKYVGAFVKSLFKDY